MAKSRATWIWLSVALIGAVLALAWPSIEQQLRVSGVPCPWPFSLFHAKHGGAINGDGISVDNSQLPVYTLEELKKYDGSDESLPILLAIGGKVLYTTCELGSLEYFVACSAQKLMVAAVVVVVCKCIIQVVDVTTGAKFYGPGKMYHQFAGTACTRALTLSSLDKKDVSDDVSDFTDKQKQEMEETILFYVDKYPTVGVLA